LALFFYNKYSPLNKEFAKVRPRIYGFLADYFSNILSVYFFSNKDHEKQKLQELTSEFVHKSVKCGIFLRNYYALHGITVALYMFILLVLLGYLASYNLVTPGDFVLVFMINLKIVDLLFEISNLSREFIANCAVVENAIEILDLPFVQQENKTLPAFMKNEMSIEFQNVSFKYNQNKGVFDNLSVKIEPGTKVALVGYSGGGKTSFVNIILRLYEIQSGKILIGNFSLQDIELKTLCNAVSFIPQDPVLFHRSIIENIRYGNLNATDEEVIIAAKKASAHDFINALTDGYETVVGERGAKLSGGQRQRIAIARAILKNSPIFILDEATSQLDSITENNIRTNINEIIKDKTALIVAHRLSTIVKMDRILVFDNGKIIQDSTYDQLLSQQGLFKELWEKQK
jgi:ATP-binding cassette subfamily B protein